MFKFIAETMLLHLYVGLLFECPFKNELEDCPFKTLRHTPIKKRLEEYKSLAHNEMKDLIDRHIHCVKNRERLNLPNMKIKSV